VLEAAAARKCVSHVREHDVCILQGESPPGLKPLPLINMSARRPVVSELSENIMRERESAVTLNNRDTVDAAAFPALPNVSKFFQ
jgi:hypothetical protein